MSGERYLADARTKLVHDLDAETAACGVDEIVRRGRDRPFETIDLAKLRGFTPCGHCVSADRR